MCCCQLLYNFVIHRVVHKLHFAGCHPAGLLCEVVDPHTGEMAHTLQLLEMAQTQRICCVTIKDLIRYRITHEAPSSMAPHVMLSAHELDWTGIICANGQKAAFTEAGQVSTGRPRVCVVRVRLSGSSCILSCNFALAIQQQHGWKLVLEDTYLL
jgi:hypothetical protein